LLLLEGVYFHVLALASSKRLETSAQLTMFHQAAM
jgi:hypothetical protein